METVLSTVPAAGNVQNISAKTSGTIAAVRCRGYRRTEMGLHLALVVAVASLSAFADTELKKEVPEMQGAPSESFGTATPETSPDIKPVPTGPEDIPMPDSESPDGRYAFFLTPPSSPVSVGVLRLVDVFDNEDIATFDALGYFSTSDRYVTEAIEETKIFWSPSSRWFAHRYRETKRSYRIAFYFLGPSGIRQVLAPSYLQNVFGRADVVCRGRYLAEQPKEWIECGKESNPPKECFVLEVWGSIPDELQLERPPERHFYQFRVTLEMTGGGNMYPSIRIASIEEVECYNPHLPDKP